MTYQTQHGRAHERGSDGDILVSLGWQVVRVCGPACVDSVDINTVNTVETRHIAAILAAISVGGSRGCWENSRRNPSRLARIRLWQLKDGTMGQRTTCGVVILLVATKVAGEQNLVGILINRRRYPRSCLLPPCNPLRGEIEEPLGMTASRRLPGSGYNRSPTAEPCGSTALCRPTPNARSPQRCAKSVDGSQIYPHLSNYILHISQPPHTRNMARSHQESFLITGDPRVEGMADIANTSDTVVFDVPIESEKIGMGGSQSHIEDIKGEGAESEMVFVTPTEKLGFFRAVQRYKYATFLCFLAGLNGWCDGYEQGMSGSIIALTGFVGQFGVPDPVTGKYALVPTDVSLFTSMKNVGAVIGGLIFSWPIDRFGRKFAFYLINLLMVTCCLIEMFAVTGGQWIAARLVDGE